MQMRIGSQQRRGVKKSLSDAARGDRRRRTAGMTTKDLGRDLAVVLGGLLPIVTAMLLVPLRGEMLAANIALILMATVVLAASLGDRTAGIVGALAATLSFDF